MHRVVNGLFKWKLQPEINFIEIAISSKVTTVGVIKGRVVNSSNKLIPQKICFCKLLPPVNIQDIGRYFHKDFIS